MVDMTKNIIRISKIVFGTFLLALSVVLFIIPYNILSGGVAGIAVALEPFFHYDATLVANILVVAFLLMGLVFLGKQFVADSILSSLCYPVFTTLITLTNIQVDVSAEVASIYAGLFGGIGIGIVMSVGSSTGGVDIPEMILAKVFHVKVHTMVMLVDGLTVVLGVIAYDLSAVLIGMLSVFVSSYAIGKVLSLGQGTAKSVQVISDKLPDINDKIQNVMSRGTTIFSAEGGYSGEKRNVLLCVVAQREYGQLLSIIEDADPNAFVITTDASDMHGEGFTWESSSRM